MTFLFIDYETFNKSPKGGRASQFAAIRTDENLNILKDRSLNIFCEQIFDNIPSPEAALITGITPQKIQRIKNGTESVPKGNNSFDVEVLNEYFFTKKILEEMSEHETCVLGYNNVAFDDEFTRNLAYRNLFDPYQHEYKNGNTRFDVYFLVQATYVLRPHLLNFPTKINKESGKVERHSKTGEGISSFRLEDLSKANDIIHENAHDAFNDVEATIGIMKIIKQKDPEFFEQIFYLRNKHNVVDWLKNKVNYQPGSQGIPFLHISSFYGMERYSFGVVQAIIEHPANNNAIICIDLSTEIKSFLDLEPDEIRKRLYMTNSELDKLKMVRPGIMIIKRNQCPVLAQVNEIADKMDDLDLNRASLRSNLNLLKEQNIEISNKMKEVFNVPFPEDDTDSDLMIYSGGFFNYEEVDEKNKFHTAILENRLFEYEFKIDSKRLKDMIFKVKARNFPNSLSSDEKIEWIAYSRNRLIDKSYGAEITVDEFDNELQDVLSKYKTNEDLIIIREIEEYVQHVKQINNCV